MTQWLELIDLVGIGRSRPPAGGRSYESRLGLPDTSVHRWGRESAGRSLVPACADQRGCERLKRQVFAKRLLARLLRK